jgi:DnaJ-class molecular chaperone
MKSSLTLTGDQAAASKFSEIARAYEVLNDETKRQIYDT